MSAEFDVETSYDLKDFIAELRRLADSLESGEEFSLDMDGETVTIPAGALVSVEFEQEDGIAEIEFQLRWEVEEEEGDEQDEEDEDQGEQEEA
ncbi:MAG: amphi-Trp domain-containing protein [Mesorhizobium sp.]